MLLETYGLSIDPRLSQVIAGLILGTVFGIAAQISRFCLRRAVAGPPAERASAGAVWLTALATAVLAFAIVGWTGLLNLDGHRFLSANLPVAALLVGGLAFGTGMVLTRGCISRLTVLSATGNLRALTVLLIFAIAAHATLKGVLAPLRTGLGEVTLTAPLGSLSETAIGVPLLLVLVAGFAVFLVRRARPHLGHLTLGAVIGLVAVAGWLVTSFLLFDEFDPLPVQSAAFTLPWSDTLFWTIASSSIPAGFGVGFIAGVLGGSFVSAAVRGELALQSFENGGQTVRYVAGGALMGVGGVLAGGCTVGAGLSGVATGSLAALIALGSIVAGGWATAALSPARRGFPVGA